MIHDAFDEYKQARDALAKSEAAVQKLAEPAKKAALAKRKRLVEELAEVDRELRSLGGKRTRTVTRKRQPVASKPVSVSPQASPDSPEARRLYRKIATRRKNLQKHAGDLKKVKEIGDEIYVMECALEDLGLPKENVAAALA